MSHFTLRVTAALSFAIVGSLVFTARADWATYQGNDSHSGYVPGGLSESNWGVQWTAPVISGAFNGIAVGGGGVYVTRQYGSSPSPTLFALDQTNGTLLWNKAFSNNDTTSAPAYSGGIVYAQNDGHSALGGNALNAYNAKTGATVFNAPYQAQWETYLNPTPFAGSIYMGGGYYGGIYAVDAAAGGQKWFGYAPQYDGWTPAVDTNYCYVFTGSGDTVPIVGQFRMINRTTGVTTYEIDDHNFQWNGYTMNTAVVLGAHSDAFSTNEAGSVYPNFSDNGRLIKWDLQADATHTPHIAWILTDHYTGQVTLANDTLFVNDGGTLQALDESTGSTRWTWAPPVGQTLTGPTIATDNLIFATTTTGTYAIDEVSHSTIWSYPKSGDLALSDYTLYIAATDGSVTAISVPEPTCAAVVLVAASALLARRR